MYVYTNKHTYINTYTQKNLRRNSAASSGQFLCVQKRSLHIYIARSVAPQFLEKNKHGKSEAQYQAV